MSITWNTFPSSGDGDSACSCCIDASGDKDVVASGENADATGDKDVVVSGENAEWFSENDDTFP